MAPRQHQSGFTLLEILVAVLITGMLGLGVWQVMNQLISAREGVDRVAGEFERVQRAVMLLERDLFQVINRPVRDGFGDSVPALTSRQQDATISLTRQGWRNPRGDRRSELQRVEWEYDENEQSLIRRYWVVLDQAQTSEPREQNLLDHVTDMEVRYRTRNDSWASDWPAEEPGTDAPPGGLPLAVEVTFTHERFGVITRLIDLGGFDPGQVRAAQEQRDQQDEEPPPGGQEQP